MFSLSFLLIGIIVILTLLHIFLKPTKPKTEENELFVEPPGNFILGHALIISSPTVFLDVASKMINTYGKNLKGRIGPRFAPAVKGFISTDHKFVEFILSGNEILTKSQNYFYVKPWLGNGLLVSTGKYWKRHRKILTPAFNASILKMFVQTFEDMGNILVQKLQNYDELPSVELDPLIALCTLDVICETAMGTKINAQSGENSEYVNAVGEMCRLAIRRCLSPIKLFRKTFWLTRDYYLQEKLLKTLHDFTLNVINLKQENLDQKKTTKSMAFLDLLLTLSDDEGVELTQKEIREEVDTFMFAGHDTTSTAIAFTLFCLAEHLDIQEQAFQEQKSLFGEDKNPEITYSDLQNMKYLENVIKETLRLYPPVPVLGRYTDKDVDFDGHVIPKGHNIAIFVYGMHRDPEYFPEPEKFNPDRFENFESVPYSYIPFSAGPRNCIGQKFAMLEIKSIVSKVIRHFEILPTNPRHSLELSVDIVLKSANGIKVRLKSRNSEKIETL